MIVKKAYNMADMMHIPVLGVVENFSYLECRTALKKINVFGQELCRSMKRKRAWNPVFGNCRSIRLYAEKADEAKIFEIDNPYLADGVETLKNL